MPWARERAGRIRWYANRLRAMGPGEVAARARIHGRHLADDLVWRAARGRWRRQWYRVELPPPLGEPIGFLVRERAESLLSADAEAAGSLVRGAEAALAGRFAFFGYEEVQLSRPLELSRDPIAGFRWPDRHAKSIDYRHMEGADPKWIWELNRCQHVPVLVAAWLLTGRGEFVRCAVDDLLHWIRTTPPGRGVAWSNGYEAALRAISFAVVLDGLRGSAFLRDADEREVRLSLWQHSRWILRDPSLGSSANNHRLTELAGLFVVAALVPDLPGSAEVGRRALGALEVEVDRQILPDGGAAEQSFAYGVYVVDLVLMAVAVARRAGLASARLEAALARAADALAAQISADEPDPRYGDSDDGRAIVLDGDDLRSARGVCAGIAACLGSPSARLAAPRLDAATIWLFGRDGMTSFEATEPAPPPGSRHLPDAGLVILRRAGSRALVDVGPLGYLSLAAHGHADALQVTLSDGRGELVSDPGVGSYFRRAAWRRQFRGTGFHATVEVDGLDQSVPGGPFLWTRHAAVKLLQVDLARGIVIAEHDGYARLDDPVRHVRAAILLPDGALVVCDHLGATGAHRYRQSWPLHPSLAVELSGERAARVTHEGEPRLLLGFAGAAGRLAVDVGRTDPVRGWWSPRLEAVAAAPLLSLEVERAGPVDVATLLVPAVGAWPERRFEVGREAGLLHLAVSGGTVALDLALDFSDRAQPLREIAVASTDPSPRQTVP